MATPFDASYKAALLPPQPSVDDLQRLVEPYEAIIATQFRAIVERTEASTTYPWLDTKIDLNTGRDYPADDPLFGRSLVSGWVQGRGLEAIVGFARWLEAWAGDREVEAEIVRCRRLAAALLGQVRAARAVNGGHLFFYMTPGGRAFHLDEDGRRVDHALRPGSPYTFSDLFAAKGMYAAAQYLGDEEALAEGRAFCLAIYGSILDRSFTSDQPQPKVLAKAWVPGAHPHGPHMIAQGMATLFVQHEPGPAATEMGLRLARYVWQTHVNVGRRWRELQALDLVEFVDAQGRPYRDDGGVISDPGHSLEFAGLFLKLSAAARRSGGAGVEQRAELRAMEREMPSFLAHNFANGFRPDAGGIIKTIDLLSRQAVDDTMPWWSLPETIRSALECLQVAETGEQRAQCLAVLAAAHNAFVTHYVKPETYLMGVKLRDSAGRVSDIVPAYPDADPGYHTALSLIDALEAIRSSF